METSIGLQKRSLAIAVVAAFAIFGFILQINMAPTAHADELPSESPSESPTPQGSVQGRKYIDDNRDGDRDSDEERLNGWTITLYDSSWNELESVETGSGDFAVGQYRFTVDIGDYYVCEEDRGEGYGQTQPMGDGAVDDPNSDKVDFHCHSVTIEEDTTTGFTSFGNYEIEKGSIYGLKYDVTEHDYEEELDERILTAGHEEYINGWTITVYDTDWTEVDSVETAERTIGETTYQGAYYFELYPGTYYICEEEREGWLQISPSDGVLDDNDQYCYEVEIDEGDELGGLLEEPTYNFSNRELEPGTVYGRKYHDENVSGAYDESEEYLNGWTINLYDTDWELVDTTETDDLYSEYIGDSGEAYPGAYEFEVYPGTYYICEELQKGWAQTVPASGEMNDETDEYCYEVEVEEGGSHGSYNFGNTQYGKLIVIKKVVNDHGNTNEDFDFTMQISAKLVDESQASFVGDENGVEVLLWPGSYAVTEADHQFRYDPYTTENCEGTIAAGQTITCTITNDDENPFLNDSPGTGGGGGGTGVNPTGGTGEVAGATTDNGSNGGSTTCNGPEGDLTIIIDVQNPGGGTAGPEDFTYNIANPACNKSVDGQGSGDTHSLPEGDYTISDTDGTSTAQAETNTILAAVSGYTLTSISGDCSAAGGVTVVAGSTVSCTLTYSDSPALGDVVAQASTGDVAGVSVAQAQVPILPEAGITEWIQLLNATFMAMILVGLTILAMEYRLVQRFVLSNVA